MSLSTHLLDQHERRAMNGQQYAQPGPSVQASHQPRHFSPMYGAGDMMNHHGQASPNPAGSFSRWSEEKIAALQVRLNNKLGPEFIAQRPGPGGGPKLSYVEGWKVINLANEVFGFNGWSSSIVSLTTDFIDVNDQGRVSTNVTAIVRITLADGSWHEDVGCGQGENAKGKSAALDKAKKEAVTDATKRALRTFGNVLGNCLYDKEYTKEVVKMKVPPAKFNPNELERRPEFTVAGAPASTRTSVAPQHPPPVSEPALPSVSHIAATSERKTSFPSPTKEDMDFMIDENFDAEFLAAQGESFMEVDKSMAVPKTVNDSSMAATYRVNDPPQRAALPPAAAAVQKEMVSGYQHRHRPDAPVDPIGRSPFSRSRSAGTTAFGQGAPEAVRGKSVEAPTRYANGPTTDREEQVAGSSSGSDATLSENKLKTPNTNRPALPAANMGQSARALAISSAFAAAQVSTTTLRTPPGRSESPRIPNGGVEAVATKASGNMHQQAIALGLEEGRPTDDYRGFSSARGMKRIISRERFEKSFPNKANLVVKGEWDSSQPNWAKDGPGRAAHRWSGA